MKKLPFMKLFKILVLSILGILLIFLLSQIIIKTISAHLMAESLHPNDKFTVIIAPDDPFRDTLKIEGKIIDKKGDWVLYEDEEGDTFSINIYEHIKYFKVEKYE